MTVSDYKELLSHYRRDLATLYELPGFRKSAFLHGHCQLRLRFHRRTVGLDNALPECMLVDLLIIEDELARRYASTIARAS